MFKIGALQSPEAGILCSVQYYDKNGLAQPPCCLRILTGMMAAVVAEYEEQSASICLYCGQILASLKMPGGQLPWDTDVDAPMFAVDFYNSIENIIPKFEKYGLKASVNKERHQINEAGELEGGAVTIRHIETSYSLDNYAKAPSNLKCGHQKEKDRARTMINLDGFYVPGPDNPGKYGRTYGSEILRHVLHIKSSTNAYNDQKAKFKECGTVPEHACLNQYPPDGNIQFRNDQRRLLPLS